MSALHLIICMDIWIGREVLAVHWHDFWHILLLRWAVAGSEKHHSSVVVAGARPKGVDWIHAGHVAQDWLGNFHAVAGSSSMAVVSVGVSVDIVGIATSAEVSSPFLSLCSKLVTVLVAKPLACTCLNARVIVCVHTRAHLTCIRGE